MSQKSETTGIFVSLRSTLRVVFLRYINFRHYQYDVFKPWDKIEAVVLVIEELAKENKDFTKKIAAVDEKYYRTSSHRTRHYVNGDRNQLYGVNRPDLADKYSRQVADIWLATNLGMPEMLQVIKEACEAAEIDYGTVSSLKW